MMKSILVLVGAALFSMYAVLIIQLFHTTETYYWAFATPDWHGSWMFYHMIDLQIRFGTLLTVALGLPGMLMLVAAEHPIIVKRILKIVVRRLTLTRPR